MTDPTLTAEKIAEQHRACISMLREMFDGVDNPTILLTMEAILERAERAEADRDALRALRLAVAALFRHDLDSGPQLRDCWIDGMRDVRKAYAATLAAARDGKV